MRDMREQLVIALQKIAENWGLLVAESIKQEVTGIECLRRIASVLSIFKDQYQEARKKLNFIII